MLQPNLRSISFNLLAMTSCGARMINYTLQVIKKQLKQGIQLHRLHYLVLKILSMARINMILFTRNFRLIVVEPSYHWHHHHQTADPTHSESSHRCYNLLRNLPQSSKALTAMMENFPSDIEIQLIALQLHIREGQHFHNRIQCPASVAMLTKLIGVYFIIHITCGSHIRLSSINKVPFLKQ